jgi:hypothetical protein
VDFYPKHPLKSMRLVVIVCFSPAHPKFISYFVVVEQVYYLLPLIYYLFQIHHW